MKNTRSERLSEYLLDVDEEILANAYEVDDFEKLQRYAKARKASCQKPFYSFPAFRRAAALAACLLLVMGVVNCVPSGLYLDRGGLAVSPTGNGSTASHQPGKDPIVGTVGSQPSQAPNMGTAGNQTEEYIYVVGDGEDIYGLGSEEVKSRNEIYISYDLQQKMQEYSGTKAVFHVIVEFPVTQEDNDEFSPDDELFQLYKQQMDKAYADYKEAWDDRFEPHVTKEIINQLYRDYTELRDKYINRKEELWSPYFRLIFKMRLEYATQVSKITPILIAPESNLFSSYGCAGVYVMDLTADDIYKLAEIGGYIFKLATADTKYTENYIFDETE